MTEQEKRLNELLKVWSKKDLWEQAQNKNAIIAQLRHRIEIVERALDKACEDIRKVVDCCWWAEKYIPEKVTPQAYIERSEKERRSEQ